MMLLSLIFITSNAISFIHGLASRKLLFLRNSSHERKATGNQVGGQLAFQQRWRSVPSLEFRGRHANPTRKESAEATEAGKTDCHANVGDGQIGQNQQMLDFLDLRSRAILMRGFAKDGLEQPNEMKVRETGDPGHRPYGEGFVLPVPQ